MAVPTKCPSVFARLDFVNPVKYTHFMICYIISLWPLSSSLKDFRLFSRILRLIIFTSCSEFENYTSELNEVIFYVS